jgi:hypothetical protein
MSDELLSEIENGEGLTLRDLAAVCPRQRRGKPVSLSCVLRWCLIGVRGPDGARIKLEAARLSGKWISTRRALRRFVQAQTPSLEGEPTLARRTPSKSQAAADRAARALEKIGI